MGDRTRERGRRARGERAVRLAGTYRRLERTLERLDLDDEAALADAVIVALRATDRAYELETAAGGRPGAREPAE